MTTMENVFRDENSKFPLGQTVMTRSIADQMIDEQFAVFVSQSMVRHMQGDWGNLDEEDKKENEFSLRNGYRLLSAYVDEKGVKIWIITEADRSATTILFPSDY